MRVKILRTIAKIMLAICTIGFAFNLLLLANLHEVIPELSILWLLLMGVFCFGIYANLEYLKDTKFLSGK